MSITNNEDREIINISIQHHTNLIALFSEDLVKNETLEFKLAIKLKEDGEIEIIRIKKVK